MDNVDKYLKDKIRLFGGNLSDAKGGAMAINKDKYTDFNPRSKGILETLYEVYRIKETSK